MKQKSKAATRSMEKREIHSKWTDIINADNLDFQPRRAEVLIGSVNAVNGEGAIEVTEFTPTQAELLELAVLWTETFLSRALFVFATGQVGSTDLRLAPYAERRVLRIVAVVGDKAVEAVRECRNRFADEMGAARWEEFNAYLGPNHIQEHCGRPQ